VAVGVRLQRHLERRALHRQVGELRRDPILQLARGRHPRLAELDAQRVAPLRQLLSALLELGPALVGVLEPLDLGAAALRMGEDRVDRAAVLPLQPVEDVESLLDLLQAPRLRVDAIEVPAKLVCQIPELDPHRPRPLG
jgi:hypothetical protein